MWPDGGGETSGKLACMCDAVGEAKMVVRSGLKTEVSWLKKFIWTSFCRSSGFTALGNSLWSSTVRWDEHSIFKNAQCQKSNRTMKPKSIAAPNLPSERVLTVWGNLADFIIAVKVMISVRSNLLHPVQSPFINRIRCFWQKENNYLNTHKVHKANKCEHSEVVNNRFCWILIHQKQEHVLIPVRLHMLHLGFPSAAMRIQLKPCMLLQLTVADFLVLKEKCSNS